MLEFLGCHSPLSRAWSLPPVFTPASALEHLPNERYNTFSVRRCFSSKFTYWLRNFLPQHAEPVALKADVYIDKLTDCLYPSMPGPAPTSFHRFVNTYHTALFPHNMRQPRLAAATSPFKAARTPLSLTVGPLNAVPRHCLSRSSVPLLRTLGAQSHLLIPVLPHPRDYVNMSRVV